MTTGTLLVVGFALLTGLGWDDPGTLGSESPSGSCSAASSRRVTPGTPASTAVDYGQMGPDSLLVTDMLMFIGGGSASPAGGIKVTTLAVLLLIVRAEIRGEREVVAFGRARAGADPPPGADIVVVAVRRVVLATLLLVATNELGLSSALFESISAFSTTGLSTGVTGMLDTAGQAILMVLMFLGRVGPITLGVALVLRERERRFSHPEERPIVG